MRFEWDESKNRTNYRKHAVWFEEAQTIWADSRSIEFFDPEHSEEEDRFLRIGYSTGERLLLVVFCERESGEVIRLISARKATAKEAKHMKKEYDLKKLKRRPGTPKFDPEAAKIPISIRLDGSVLAALKTEAERLGIPYQTYIGSVLHRFAQGELIDRKTVDVLKQLKVS